VIRAVIFDIGGVLVRTEDRSSRNALEARLGLTPGESEHIVFNSEMGSKAQTGAVTTAELWDWVQDHLGLNDAELAAFQRDFWGGDRLDVGLVDFIRRLKSDYQTAIISNATDNLHQFITEIHPIFDAFDLVVGSAYEKVAKPDPIIFQRTLDRLGRQPAEAVFVDDFAHNVEGARAVGMQAIHYTPDTDVPAALARLGVQPKVPPATD
jgi:glucose-1-phosphatase